jgi:hypothetical protein
MPCGSKSYGKMGAKSGKRKKSKRSKNKSR